MYHQAAMSSNWRFPRLCSTCHTLAWLLLLALELCGADELPSCLPKDFHYEFTECDHFGGRWRVSVPKPNTCVGGAPNAPVRVNDCATSCKEGTYFNRSGLECLPCPPGSYSLGGGVKFDTWEHLPDGFHVTEEPLEISYRFMYQEKGNSPGNCSEYGWHAAGSYVASLGGPCTSTLMYSVKLVKPGRLTYSYQFPDDSLMFNFEAQNDQCQSIEEVEKYKFQPVTEEGQWKNVVVPLKAGLNVLYWKTIGIGAPNSFGRKPQPVKIKTIEISGVAYTSECSPCPPGTYSQTGYKECLPCLENTYSDVGASSCQPCNHYTEYAPKGSAMCLERPPCTDNDYYETHTPCDENKKTELMYRWIEPKICRDDLTEAATLPVSGKKSDCPPCNPGMEYSNKTMCAFCPKDHYSNGAQSCQRCPASTAPNYGLYYKWWSEMPPGMTTKCMSADEKGCQSQESWLTGGDSIHTSTSHAKDSYLLLTLDVPGFRGRERIANGRPAEIGRISFTFKLSCSGSCYFIFMMATRRRPLTVIQRWTESTEKQHFSYAITQNDSYQFSWAFQRDSTVDEGKSKRNIHDSLADTAMIYDITVTNTMNGGASECVSCPQGTEPEGCIPCPPGHFIIDRDNLQCKPCRPNTYVSDPLPYGPESCKPCGPGLRSEDGQTCYSNCRVFLPDAQEFDFSTFPLFSEIRGSHLFTGSGTQYFHVFNISLCGLAGKSAVTCQNNVTSQFDDQEEAAISGLICRSTIVPSVGGTSPALATQAVSLGDALIGITTKYSYANVTVVDEIAKAPGNKHDINFFYTSSSATPACKNGRTTTITLRCDSNQEGNGLLTTPVSCRDGTCDGCNFHFLWRTRLACRVCTEADYEIVKGECIHGVQTIHYIFPQGCIPRGGGSKPLTRTLACSAVPQEIQIVIGVGVALAVLLLVLVLYFWKKNQKLEYKYMKLVQSSSSKECELPPAESCAIDDEEEEHYDSITFNEKGTSLFGKFRTIRVGNSKADGQFETIHLTKKDSVS